MPSSDKCASCALTLTAPKQCSGCHKTSYCGKTCQKQHWKSGHKKVCKILGETSGKGSLPSCPIEAQNPDEIEMIVNVKVQCPPKSSISSVFCYICGIMTREDGYNMTAIPYTNFLDYDPVPGAYMHLPSPALTTAIASGYDLHDEPRIGISKTFCNCCDDSFTSVAVCPDCLASMSPPEDKAALIAAWSKELALHRSADLPLDTPLLPSTETMQSRLNLLDIAQQFPDLSSLTLPKFRQTTGLIILKRNPDLSAGIHSVIGYFSECDIEFDDLEPQGSPVTFMTPHLEEYAFAHLFPFGQGGWIPESFVGLEEYTRARLYSFSPAWRDCPDYVMFSFHRLVAFGMLPESAIEDFPKPYWIANGQVYGNLHNDYFVKLPPFDDC